MNTKPQYKCARAALELIRNRIPCLPWTSPTLPTRVQRLEAFCSKMFGADEDGCMRYTFRIGERIYFNSVHEAFSVALQLQQEG